MPTPRLVVVTAPVRGALRLATKDAVNQVALLITQDARARVRAVLGPEQRMSRVTTRKRNDKGGRTTRVTAETIAKGGTKINPAYKNADSVTNPVAIIGARGPAHLIEHRRKGGYKIRPSRPALTEPSAQDLERLFADVFGTPTATAKRAKERVGHAPALKIGDDFWGAAIGGAITRPRAPITAAFRAAPRTMERAARDALEQSYRRRMGGR